MMIQIDYPYHFDHRGRTATTSYEDHICDMIEQFLFTNPGERVNRPDFGSGLLQMAFEGNSPELAAAVEYTIQAGLQRWLGDVIEVRSLEVVPDGPVLQILIRYLIRRTHEEHIGTFKRSKTHE